MKKNDTKSKPLKTPGHFLDLADDLALDMIRDQSLDAEQTAAINQIKKDYKPKRDGLKKTITALKGRLGRWIAKHAAKLFDGADTGTISTNLVEITRRQNPPSIVPADKSLSEDALVNLALQKGFDAVIESRPRIRKEQLEFLSDDELASIGWQRRRTHTITYRPLANRERKTATKQS